MFENGGALADNQTSVQSYLDIYQSGPLTKAEMLNRFADGKGADPEYAKLFKIKRRRKNKNDFFWTLCKVHGIENIALLNEAHLMATNGDTMQI